MNSEISVSLANIRREITSNYTDSLARVVRHFRVDLAAVDFSKRELRLALEEAEIDVEALLRRRSPRNGVSLGKVAGVYAYRLSRFDIVHLAESAYEQPTSFLVQHVVALNLVKRRILRIKIGADRMLELGYQMSRRHANQETLGLCFDVLMDATQTPPTAH
ncbi:MAG: hypothetical protein H7Z12_01720 [Rhodospirillaceae bacterium]|nr:hypothetical protein [Rhodospirillales bacterium]